MKVNVQHDCYKLLFMSPLFFAATWFSKNAGITWISFEKRQDMSVNQSKVIQKMLLKCLHQLMAYK
jgi:hypothetical protein